MIMYTNDGLTSFEISDIDYELVNSYRWHLCGKYIRSSTGQWLHRLILNAPKGLDVDHINRNTLNNTRENLRLVTRLENNRNRSTFFKYPNKSTGIYGIDAVPSRRKHGRMYFRVRIKGLKTNKFSKLIDAIKYRNAYLKSNPEILNELEAIFK